MRVADAIRNKLTSEFAPLELGIEDESARHASHAGVLELGQKGETHFHVRIVSEHFAGLSRLARQRRVHEALATELKGPVHALSLSLLTPAEAAVSRAAP